MCKVSKIHFCRTLVCSIRMWAINAMRSSLLRSFGRSAESRKETVPCGN